MSDQDTEIALLHELIVQAKRRLPEGIWNYVVGGAESETTLRRNRQAIDALAFRPRVLRDVLDVDCTAALFGKRLRLPVILAPIGSLQDLHPGGGAEVGRGSAGFGAALMLSSQAAPGLEETAAACSGYKIYQLYVRGDRDFVDERIRQAVDAGFDAFCFTVDLDYYSQRERDLAKRFVTTARKGKQDDSHQKLFTWDDVKRIKDRLGVPLILKGIATAEDAAIACEHGVDGVYVSNHGGRQLDHGRGGFDVLPEVVAEVAGRATVMVDGGVLRGTDIVKAMALGADAVGIGRLTGFALAAAGAPGVERMLELLEREVRTCLGLLGVRGYDELDGSYLHPVTPVRTDGMRSAYPLLDVETW